MSLVQALHVVSDADAEALAEVVADLTWYHAKALMRVVPHKRKWRRVTPLGALGAYHQLILAACCVDRMSLQLREACGRREEWEPVDAG